MQLNAYANLLRAGYATEIRRHFGHPTPDDGLYSLQFELVSVHSSLPTVQIIVYPVKTQRFRCVLDTWFRYKGKPELMQTA